MSTASGAPQALDRPVAGHWYKRTQQGLICCTLTLPHWSLRTRALFGHEGNSRMAKTTQLPAKSRKRAMIKACLLIAFMIAAIYIVRFTPVKAFLTRQALGHLLETAGFGAPLIFMLVYAAGVCSLCAGDPADRPRGCTVRGLLGFRVCLGGRHGWCYGQFLDWTDVGKRICSLL